MTIKRAQSIDQLRKLVSRFRSPEALAAVEIFESKSTDVFISTFPKSGTTWMQQIVHQLRCKIDDKYDDIYEVVPWLESAVDMDVDPSAPQKGSFRVFKSHLSFAGLPRNGRYITVIRDPVCVIPSWFRFYEGWFFETGSITIDDFTRNYFFDYFENHQSHFESWFKRIGEKDTLVLSYEDMVSEADKVPAVVAKFLDLSIDKKTMLGVVNNCSREYMFQNKSKFEEGLFRKYLDAALDLPHDGDSSKVNHSAVDITLSDEILSEFGALWGKTIGRTLGFKDYQQFRNALPNPLNAVRS